MKMTMVQIPEALLVDLYVYFTCGNGMDDPSADTIRDAVKRKYESNLRRTQYTVDVMRRHNAADNGVVKNP